MAQDEKDRMETDAEGKQIATDFFKHFGYVVTATTEPMNRLDGLFNTEIGICGLEVKNMSVERYTKYDDILIAADKYEYSTTNGRQASGLVTTFKFDYVKTDCGIICLITNFDKCKGLAPLPLPLPTGNYKDAPKKWQLVYQVPRQEAHKWLITNDKIERL